MTLCYFPEGIACVQRRTQTDGEIAHELMSAQHSHRLVMSGAQSKYFSVISCLTAFLLRDRNTQTQRPNQLAPEFKVITITHCAGFLSLSEPVDYCMRPIVCAGRESRSPKRVVPIDALPFQSNMKHQGGFQCARGAERAQPILPCGITGY